ncbi:uncharacterized protein JCM10292_007641 [Rhodotorula paludigena]|uniref:uncharacterized protein n=1 Tax=Rhodotorula paludigena TaxID=86838 RepID=UPI003174E237
MSPSNEMQPRATLDGLPLEIKTRIVEMCAEQDERLRVMIAEAERRVENNDDPDYEALVETFARRHQSSLGALFCTSTTWSALAAPRLFTVLKLSKTHTPAFRFRIAPLRSRHFRQLVLDEPAEDDEDNSFVKRNVMGDVFNLPLSNVDSVVVTSHAAPALFLVHSYMPWYDLNSPKAFLAIKLNALLGQVTTLDLRLTDVRHPNISRVIVTRAKQLRELYVNVDALATDVGPELWDILASAPSLVKLRLTTSRAFEFSNIPPPTIAPRWPPLRSLSFEGEILNESVGMFVAYFASSLQELNIHNTLTDF